MTKNNFDYAKLRGKIREKYKRQELFAKDIGIANTTLSSKLNNITEFSQTQILRAAEVLNLKKEEITPYFFCVISSENLN